MPIFKKVIKWWYVDLLECYGAVTNALDLWNDREGHLGYTDKKNIHTREYLEYATLRVTKQRIDEITHVHPHLHNRNKGKMKETKNAG